jgi:hypothetical protein
MMRRLSITIRSSGGLTYRKSLGPPFSKVTVLQPPFEARRLTPVDPILPVAGGRFQGTKTVRFPEKRALAMSATDGFNRLRKSTYLPRYSRIFEPFYGHPSRRGTHGGVRSCAWCQGRLGHGEVYRSIHLSI